jgi:hypothetical protein
MILGLGPYVPLVDHINRNGLDNRVANLRTATSAQNCHNSGRRNFSASQYKGVWRHVSGLFGGAITDPSGVRRSIGYYHTERQAARAHDALARHYRGEFAFQNIPDDPMTGQEISSNVSLAREFDRHQREEAHA